MTCRSYNKEVVEGKNEKQRWTHRNLRLTAVRVYPYIVAIKVLLSRSSPAISHSGIPIPAARVKTAARNSSCLSCYRPIHPTKLGRFPKVKRDSSWSEIESANLVPGDVIAFKIGDIVPADCRLGRLRSPVNHFLSPRKWVTNVSREAKGVVISPGANTFFGRAASLVGHDDDNTGHLQKTNWNVLHC
ncbi:hypothetical protein F5887DRAFT_274759 [Amanita rubescens]|nr:hypothetical protein F5887DRAFT_274759 [Amanita rubescens]